MQAVAGSVYSHQQQQALPGLLLALVRKELWSQEATFCGSSTETETVKVSREFIERLTEAVCYAA